MAVGATGGARPCAHRCGSTRRNRTSRSRTTVAHPRSRPSEARAAAAAVGASRPRAGSRPTRRRRHRPRSRALRFAARSQSRSRRDLHDQRMRAARPKPTPRRGQRRATTSDGHHHHHRHLSVELSSEIPYGMCVTRVRAEINNRVGSQHPLPKLCLESGKTSIATTNEPTTTSTRLQQLVVLVLRRYKNTRTVATTRTDSS